MLLKHMLLEPRSKGLGGVKSGREWGTCAEGQGSVMVQCLAAKWGPEHRQADPGWRWGRLWQVSGRRWQE